MAIEYRERTIGPHTYRVTQLGAKTGRAMLVKIVKITGPGVGSFVTGIGRGGTVDSALALGAGEAIHELVSRLKEDELASILDEFARHTVVVQSSEIELRLSEIFDSHFAGHYEWMVAWAKFCLEVNFSSFFGESSGVREPLRRLWKILSASMSQSTSTGTSTESSPVSATPQA